MLSQKSMPPTLLPSPLPTTALVISHFHMDPFLLQDDRYMYVRFYTTCRTECNLTVRFIVAREHSQLQSQSNITIRTGPLGEQFKTSSIEVWWRVCVYTVHRHSSQSGRGRGSCWTHFQFWVICYLAMHVAAWYMQLLTDYWKVSMISMESRWSPASYIHAYLIKQTPSSKSFHYTFELADAESNL